MSAHRLRFSALFGLVFACVFTAASDAREARPIREAIAGTWTLVSIYEEDDTGNDLDRWGNKPTGHFTADDSGHFMLQVVGRDAIEIATLAKSLVPRYVGDRRILGYAGRLLIEETASKITFQIEDAVDKAWDTPRPSTSISLTDNTLHFVSASEVSPTGAFYLHAVWKRAR
jgi:hypothetical protein